ncbi:MAG: dUTP diphosphatase [Candidatus Neomarinimicrobiota bacterium]
MHLKMKAFSRRVEEMYRKHGHFHPGDAGLDLFVVEQTTFLPGETKPVRFHIACESEKGEPYLLVPRSSISKTPLRMSNSVGIVDSGYRGELIAYCDNIKNISYTLKPGQRLFQLVSMTGSPVEFEIVDELSSTSRGEGGFGSTGE